MKSLLLLVFFFLCPFYESSIRLNSIRSRAFRHRITDEIKRERRGIDEGPGISRTERPSLHPPPPPSSQIQTGTSNRPIAVPCNGNATGCVVHVFRIQLSENINGSTKEVDLPMRPKPKYGKNVYAPIGNTESHQLTEKILAKMPDSINENVKDRVRKEEFLISPLDEEQSSNDEDIRSHLQSKLNENSSETRNQQVIQSEESFPIPLLILLLAIGVVVGVMCTCLALLLLDYRQKPSFDRSTAISYKRPSMEREMLMNRDGRTVIERTVVTKTYSSRPPSYRPPHSRSNNRYHHYNNQTQIPPENGLNGGLSSRESSRHFIQNLRPYENRKISF